jgi:hypothetical protein
VYWIEYHGRHPNQTNGRIKARHKTLVESKGEERMITYSTNWMGPINTKWMEEHGKHWAAGRIDIYGVPDEPYPIEYSLPVMGVQDWKSFSDWLDELETETLLSFNELVAQFEQTVGKKIQWLKEEKNT